MTSKTSETEKTDKPMEPMELFAQWYGLSLEHNHFEPTSMTLATVDESGMPSARVVLLKQHSPQGFRFFTNYQSLKARELGQNPKAALVFHWEKPFHRQVRIRGLVSQVTAQISDGYFQSRARGSQIGAWASPQSQEIKSREELEQAVAQYEKQFGESPIPRPKHWGGYELTPLSMEFWESGEHRLHDRLRFSRKTPQAPWFTQKLAP